MELFNGYKFNTKQIADEAMDYLNTHHGLPVQNGVTKYDESSYKQHPDGFYYIPFDAEWTAILGTPTTIELEQE